MATSLPQAWHRLTRILRVVRTCHGMSRSRGLHGFGSDHLTRRNRANQDHQSGQSGDTASELTRSYSGTQLTGTTSDNGWDRQSSSNDDIQQQPSSPRSRFTKMRETLGRRIVEQKSIQNLRAAFRPRARPSPNASQVELVSLPKDQATDKGGGRTTKRED